MFGNKSWRKIWECTVPRCLCHVNIKLTSEIGTRSASSTTNLPTHHQPSTNAQKSGRGGIILSNVNSCGSADSCDPRGGLGGRAGREGGDRRRRRRRRRRRSAETSAPHPFSLDAPTLGTGPGPGSRRRGRGSPPRPPRCRGTDHIPMCPECVPETWTVFWQPKFTFDRQCVVCTTEFLVHRVKRVRGTVLDTVNLVCVWVCACVCARVHVRMFVTRLSRLGRAIFS